MNIAFRVDASATIGSGHLMRCMTLAVQLQPHCDEIVFVCRPPPAHHVELIATSGFRLCMLTPAQTLSDPGELRHAAWLGASQTQDATETLEALSGKTWDWLVIDHYAIDQAWERRLRSTCRNILVIDDLADRSHDCDVLIDQNLYRDQENRYADYVPDSCRQFIGPQYAFLRNEFHTARKTLKERSGEIRKLFIYFGGTDPDNHTMRAIESLLRTDAELPSVDVVIGAQHPDRQNIESTCKTHGFSWHVQTQSIATLIAAADLAVGAGGISTFERLYLRLPSIVRPISFNQVEQLEYMASLGLVQLFEHEDDLVEKLNSVLSNGVEPPADCVGNDNRLVVEHMLEQATGTSKS